MGAGERVGARTGSLKQGRTLKHFPLQYSLPWPLFPPAGAVGRPFPSVSVRVARFEPGASDYTVLAEADGSGACTVTPGCDDQVGSATAD